MHKYLLLAALSCIVDCAQRQGSGPAPAVVEAPQSNTDGAENVEFAVIGDFGWGGPDEARVAELVHSWKPAFIVTVGDNNYPNGESSTIDINIGQFYHDYIHFDAAYGGPYRDRQSVTQRFFPALGNHDWKNGSVEPYTSYFELPGNERYYTTRQGPVEIFVIDSDRREPDGNTADSTQAQWLKAALAASSAPWKIVCLHHPPYSTGLHGSSLEMRWPYKEWGASVVLAGHDHDYERIVQDGFPYWVVGTGGATLREFDVPTFESAQDTMRYASQHGAMRVEASPTVLKFSFYNVARELIDSYTMKR